MSLSRVFPLLLRSLLIMVLSAPVILLLLSVQTGSAVATPPPLTADEVARIETLLLDSAPSVPSNPSQQSLRLDARDLNLLLRYSIDVMKLTPQWAGEVALKADALNAQMSVRLIDGWSGLYLNFWADFVVAETSLELDRLRIGKLQVPDGLLQSVVSRLRDNLETNNAAYQDFGELLANVERVTVEPTRMHVTLQWDPMLISRISEQAQRLFISERDQQRIIEHYRLINEVAMTIPTDIRAVSLNAFLTPLFAAAHDRSLNGSDPIAENRTLFQTLAIYVNNEDIAQLLGESLVDAVAPAKFIEVRLQRRQDLAQHLVSIAAISASAGADFALLLSTTKEAYDARYRSGFSFSDLTANSVGVALADLSTRDNDSALEMQQRFAALQSESEYMPEVGGNRDGIPESDFTALYNNRTSREYQQRLAEIQALIDARPLFQGID